MLRPCRRRAAREAATSDAPAASEPTATELVNGSEPVSLFATPEVMTDKQKAAARALARLTSISDQMRDTREALWSEEPRTVAVA